MLNGEELLKTLKPEEIILIMALRNKFRYGEVNILMRDGVPQRLIRVEMFVDLKEKRADIIDKMINQ